ncbi:MAG: hypothetical protein CSB06_01845 [Bacteroidia bacterium]|nr:MAG: hypothetical protein CSB06_01845 [Bacteroidia bacterium]
MTGKELNKIFETRIMRYRTTGDIEQDFISEYPLNSIEFLCDRKNHIDNAQWDLEDLIRIPDIDPNKALDIKRKIDASNQLRTDVVEQIDDYFFEKYNHITPQKDAFLATETPAWAIDKLSILHLKIYHMRKETLRSDADKDHLEKCNHKLSVLLQQCEDLTCAIDQLFDNIREGKIIIKTYKQMKMYNDPNMKPSLRAK